MDADLAATSIRAAHSAGNHRNFTLGRLDAAILSLGFDLQRHFAKVSCDVSYNVAFKNNFAGE
jgi:hypothetical protein